VDKLVPSPVSGAAEGAMTKAKWEIELQKAWVTAWGWEAVASFEW